MPFVDWVNEYRKQLDGKSKPFFKELGFVEAPVERITPTAAARPTPGATPTPAQNNAPEGQKMASEKPQTAQPKAESADNTMKRINIIKDVFHETLVKNAQAVDAALSKAFTTFQSGHMSVEDTKKEIDIDIKKEWDKAFFNAYKDSKYRKPDEEGKSQDEKRKKDATLKADLEIQKMIGDDSFTMKDYPQQSRGVSGGLGIFGESADSVRLAKAVVIRIICFELLGIILGAPSELSTMSLETELEALKKKERADAKKGLNAQEKIDKQFLNKDKIENEEVRLVIDGMVVILNEGAVTGTIKNVAAKTTERLFSGMDRLVKHSSMVNLAKTDTNKIGDIIIRWFLTTASFSTRLLDGHNATAIVDGLTQGYLTHMNPTAKQFIRDLFYQKLPTQFAAPSTGQPGSTAPKMSIKQFETQIRNNAKKFQVAQNTTAINRIMKECLEAFMASGRL